MQCRFLTYAIVSFGLAAGFLYAGILVKPHSIILCVIAVAIGCVMGTFGCAALYDQAVVLYHWLAIYTSTRGHQGLV